MLIVDHKGAFTGGPERTVFGPAGPVTAGESEVIERRGRWRQDFLVVRHFLATTSKLRVPRSVVVVDHLHVLARLIGFQLH